jgi:hypothetical protein
MERKAATVAVTAEEVRAALGRTRTLVSEEEKALRMRYGAGSSDLRAPLPRAAGGNQELEDELLVIEMQLMKAWRSRFAEHKAQLQVVQAQAPTLEPRSSRTKDKIVRALRKKK